MVSCILLTSPKQQLNLEFTDRSGQQLLFIRPQHRDLCLLTEPARLCLIGEGVTAICPVSRHQRSLKKEHNGFSRRISPATVEGKLYDRVSFVKPAFN